MKVAFVSDTHFGYLRHEADASVQGKWAILDAAKRADVLVLGGDIFDHRIPKLETILEVANVLQQARKLMEAKNAGGVSPLVLGIHGTHERRAKDALNPLALLAQMGLLEDLHNRTITLERSAPHQAIERIAFSGLGGIPDDLVREALRHMSCKPVADAVNFFLFHQTLREFIPVPLEELASIEDLPAGYDFYLCGHIHGHRELMGGKLVMPGSTVMTQMKDEEKKEKGYYVIDTATRKSEFVSIPTRPYEVLELKFEGAKPSEVRVQVEKELASLLAREWKDKPILKIRLMGSVATGGGEVDLSGLESDERAYISIDNQLDGAGLAAELEALKEERTNRATPLELGMAMLREQAGKAGLKPERAQELFEKYSKEE